MADPRSAGGLGSGLSPLSNAGNESESSSVSGAAPSQVLAPTSYDPYIPTHHTMQGGDTGLLQPFAQAPRSTSSMASSLEPHLLDMPNPPPIAVDADNAAAVILQHLTTADPSTHSSAMFVATELLDRGLQVADIVALIQGTIHDQLEAQRILAALKQEAAQELSLNEAELQLSPVVASQAVDHNGVVDLPSLTAGHPRLSSAYSALSRASTRPEDGWARTDVLVLRARALTRQAELSASISLLTAVLPPFLPQYMHTDVQAMLVQCAESAGSPLLFVNAVRNSHMRDPTLPWSRVCGYATLLMEEGVRPINAWEAAYAHYACRSRYTQAVHQAASPLPAAASSAPLPATLPSTTPSPSVGAALFQAPASQTPSTPQQSSSSMPPPSFFQVPASQPPSTPQQSSSSMLPPSLALPEHPSAHSGTHSSNDALGAAFSSSGSGAPQTPSSSSGQGSAAVGDAVRQNMAPPLLHALHLHRAWRMADGSLGVHLDFVGGRSYEGPFESIQPQLAQSTRDQLLQALPLLLPELPPVTPPPPQPSAEDLFRQSIRSHLDSQRPSSCPPQSATATSTFSAAVRGRSPPPPSLSSSRSPLPPRARSRSTSPSSVSFTNLPPSVVTIPRVSLAAAGSSVAPAPPTAAIAAATPPGASVAPTAAPTSPSATSRVSPLAGRHVPERADYPSTEAWALAVLNNPALATPPAWLSGFTADGVTRAYATAPRFSWSQHLARAAEQHISVLQGLARLSSVHPSIGDDMLLSDLSVAEGPAIVASAATALDWGLNRGPALENWADILIHAAIGADGFDFAYLKLMKRLAAVVSQVPALQSISSEVRVLAVRAGTREESVSAVRDKIDELFYSNRSTSRSSLWYSFKWCQGTSAYEMATDLRRLGGRLDMSAMDQLARFDDVVRATAEDFAGARNDAGRRVAAYVHDRFVNVRVPGGGTLDGIIAIMRRDTSGANDALPPLNPRFRHPAPVDAAAAQMEGLNINQQQSGAVLAAEGGAPGTPTMQDPELMKIMAEPGFEERVKSSSVKILTGNGRKHYDVHRVFASKTVQQLLPLAAVTWRTCWNVKRAAAAHGAGEAGKDCAGCSLLVYGIERETTHREYTTTPGADGKIPTVGKGSPMPRDLILTHHIFDCHSLTRTIEAAVRAGAPSWVEGAQVSAEDAKRIVVASQIYQSRRAV